ncbi:MAG: ABC transporter ATP-binding protein [Burkholderiaceae bacterium]|nr:ABC transporter ATP-binding protein [Burkholderiaceae bacterium]
MSARLLEVEGLRTAYGRSEVLFGLDLHVEAGEVVALMGRNGMGKTTTLRSIMGLTKPSHGSIRVNGIEYQGRPAFRVARAGVAIVPEGRQIFRQLSVHEHLVMARSERNASVNRWSPETVYVLFPRLQERRDHMGGQLSGGEQQMLAIGRALMTNPDMILFDEATEGLAPLVRREIWNSMRKLKDEGCAILVVDKNVHEIAELASRMYVLEKGRVAWSGSPSVLRSDAELQQRLLGI